MSKNKYYNNLNELVGAIPTTPVGHRPPPAQTTTTQWQPPGHGGTIESIPFGHCRTLHPWQRRVYQQMLQNKDIWILASPGGGKTPPVECYWAKSVLGINPDAAPSAASQQLVARNLRQIIRQPDRIPKTIIMVPTKSLATQTSLDFKRNFGKVIIDGFNLYLNLNTGEFEPIDPQYLSIIQHLFGQVANPNRDLQQAIYRRNQLVQALNSRVYSGSTDVLKERIRNENIVLKRETVLLLQNWVNEKLVGVTIGGEGSSSIGTLKSAPVVVGTYPKIAQLINSTFAKQIKFVIVDEAHKIHINVAAGEDDEKIALGLFDVMKAIKSAGMASRTNVAFLSGTENPKGAKNLAEYMNRCFDRNFNLNSISAIPEAKNPANLQVVGDDSISDNQRLVSQMVKRINSGEWGTLVIIFSGRRIRQYAESILRATGGLKERGETGITATRGPASERFKSRYEDIESMRQTTPYVTKEDVTAISRMPGAEHIEDDLLRKCVANGFGFLFSGDYAPKESREKDERGGEYIEKAYRAALRTRDPYAVGMSESDKTIVARLFKEKKIKLLMATDAIGIGVNIGVKTIIIPSLTKRSGDTTGPVHPRDLAQIIHRAGRAASKYATIYVPSSETEKVVDAVEARPEDFEELGVITPSFWKSMGVSICFKHKMFYKLYKAMQAYI